jgi:hypothetical protein
VIRGFHLRTPRAAREFRGVRRPLRPTRRPRAGDGAPRTGHGVLHVRTDEESAPRLGDRPTRSIMSLLRLEVEERGICFVMIVNRPSFCPADRPRRTDSSADGAEPRARSRPDGPRRSRSSTRRPSGDRAFPGCVYAALSSTSPPAASLARSLLNAFGTRSRPGGRRGATMWVRARLLPP